MEKKTKAIFAAAMMLTIVMAGFVATGYSNTSEATKDGTSADDAYEITLEVGQTMDYSVVFNVSSAKINKVEVGSTSGTATDTPIVGSHLTAKYSSNVVSFEATVETVANTPELVIIHGASAQISGNASAQYIKVTVLPALALKNGTLTFYKNVAGSEGTLTSNQANVIYSASTTTLPAGLHIEENGKIYGKVTAAADTYSVTITVTSLTTGVSKDLTASIQVKEVTGFTIGTVVDGGLSENAGKYYISNDKTGFKFKIDGYVADGNWTVAASEDFSGTSGKFTYSIDSDGIVTFTQTDVTFRLSGDYIVGVTHDVNGVSMYEYVTIHFQAGLGFDTAPVASIVVGLTPVTKTT